MPADLLPEIASFPEVESITLDYTFNLPVVTYGTSALPEWNLNAIKAPEIWNLGYTGNDMVVANMDTGVDMNHPDLQSKWRGGANSWYDPNGEHTMPADIHGHGTWTMGIMVGGTAGGTAIGVAPDAQWIAVKIFNDAGTASLSTIHQGFQWLLDPDGNPATDDAPDVINASWELLNSTGKCVLDFQPDIQNLKAADIAVVFAAGNSGPSNNTDESPANNPGSFAVGAADNNSLIASFSSRGPSACDGSIFPHAVAPGVNIRTSDITFGGLFPDSYAYVSGTSFAAPHVAGAMVLLSSAFPALAISEMEMALEQSASDLGFPGSDNDYGYGLIDVLYAYNLLNSMPIPSLDVFPVSYDFGNVELLSNSLPRTFAITNQGTADLVLGILLLTEQNSSEFKIINNTCSEKTLIPQSACTVDLIFSPASAGLKNAVLSIPSNDPNNGTKTVSVTGTGVSPPPLNVVSPNGSEVWQADTIQTIQWKYTGNTGTYVKIELLKNGSVNRTITSYASKGSNGIGTYRWTIPFSQTRGTDYKIRIKSTSNSSYQDTSDSVFTIAAPPPPGIAVVLPNGGDVWQAGTRQTIRWTYTGNPGTSVRIQLFKGGVLNRTITSGVSIGTGGNGSYNWTIPSSQAGGTDYQVKITSTANSLITDTSNTYFTIVGAAITIISPDGGENWVRGTTQTVRWTYTGNPGSSIKIELLRGGVFIRTIVSSVAIGPGGNGLYNWTISSYQTPGADYKIRITSTANSSIQDLSNASFTISAP